MSYTIKEATSVMEYRNMVIGFYDVEDADFNGHRYVYYPNLWIVFDGDSLVEETHSEEEAKQAIDYYLDHFDSVSDDANH